MGGALMTFLSLRGLPLTVTYKPFSPTITVEITSKWYNLFLIYPNGELEEIGFDYLDKIANEIDETPYVDHVPNPRVVIEMCKKYAWSLDEWALELIIGRWVLESGRETFTADELYDADV